MNLTRRRRCLNRFLGLLLTSAALLQGCTSDRPAISSDAIEAGDENATPPLEAGQLPQEKGDPRALPEGSSNEEGAGPVGRPDAKSVLGAGLANADRTKRLVFLHSGASW